MSAENPLGVRPQEVCKLVGYKAILSQRHRLKINKNQFNIKGCNYNNPISRCMFKFPSLSEKWFHCRIINTYVILSKFARKLDCRIEGL